MTGFIEKLIIVFFLLTNSIVLADENGKQTIDQTMIDQVVANPLPDNVSGLAGMTKEGIYTQFGKPDFEFEFSDTRRIRGHLPLLIKKSYEASSLMLEYSDRGIMLLVYRNNQWKVVKVYPSAHYYGLFTGKHQVFADELLSYDGFMVRRRAAKVHDERLGHDLLDIAAVRLWTERNNKDKFMVEALSYIIKAIARRNEVRYRQLLNEVAQSSEIPSIKQASNKAYKTLTRDRTPQFIVQTPSYPPYSILVQQKYEKADSGKLPEPTSDNPTGHAEDLQESDDVDDNAHASPPPKRSLPGKISDGAKKAADLLLDKLPNPFSKQGGLDEEE